MDLNPVRSLFGTLLMLIGGLIAFLSGGCTLLVAGASLISVIQSPSGILSLLSDAPLLLIFGGIPFAAGLGLFFIGKGLFDKRP